MLVMVFVGRKTRRTYTLDWRDGPPATDWAPHSRDEGICLFKSIWELGSEVELGLYSPIAQHLEPKLDPPMHWVGCSGLLGSMLTLIFHSITVN